MAIIKSTDTVAARPTASTPGTTGWFSPGDPANSIPATTVTFDWLNYIDGNIAFAIQQKGMNIDLNDMTQLYSAVQVTGYLTRTEADTVYVNQAGDTMTGALNMTAGSKVGSNLVDAFPAGTRLPFAQAAAPTGWTQDTSTNADNRMLRVVKTTGNGVGGSHSPILMDVVPSHSHSFSATTSSDTHSHSYSRTIQTGSAWFVGTGGDVISDVTGTTSPVTHSHTVSGTTGTNASSSNWTPRYIDMIICAKN